MIKIDRGLVGLPDVLDFTKPSRANTELCKNIDILNGEGVGQLSFSVYQDVRSQVASLTSGRCAYCGKKIIRSSLQIEHYRPKGRVDIDQEKIVPGYYWLAADWNNLLPSCQFCNGSKNVVVVSSDGNNLVESVIGKGNRFPIVNDCRSDSLEVFCDLDEQPLIYNPTCDDPDDLFSYHLVSGNYLIVRAKDSGVDSISMQRAECSINILGLNEVELTKERLDVYRRCKRQVEKLNEAIDINSSTLKFEVSELLLFLDADGNNSYLGLCRRVSFEVMNKLVAKLIIDEGLTTDDTAAISAGEYGVLKLYCGEFDILQDVQDLGI